MNEQKLIDIEKFNFTEFSHDIEHDTKEKPCRFSVDTHFCELINLLKQQAMLAREETIKECIALLKREEDALFIAQDILSKLLTKQDNE